LEGDNLERARHRIAVGELGDRSGAGERANQMQDPEVLAKRDVAVEWCRPATHDAASYGRKPGTYLLIPHDAIADNMTIEGLAQHYAVDGS
jgi:hypothetical protein